MNPGNPALPHGNETLRRFGAKGFVESVGGGARTRLVTAKDVIEPLSRAGSGAGDYFDFVTAHLATGAATAPYPTHEIFCSRVASSTSFAVTLSPASCVVSRMATRW